MFGSGLFCSRRCANSRVRTKEIKEKISRSVKKYYKNNEHVIKGKIGHKHTEETKKKLSIINKNKIHKFTVDAHAYMNKLEKQYVAKIEKYFNTNNLKPTKIIKHWFDFVNQDYIIEFTIDKTAGISDAIKRFQTITNDKRQKILICPINHFGKLRKERLLKTGAKYINIQDL